jgi:CBS domain containing-hemolysin-like protein|tara:strand:+ start:2412 stop:2759 length:348 start_codon:yes stop_codon:yes gene_type:complete
MFEFLSRYFSDLDFHKLFLYLGICLFIIYTFLNGISIDISYFGLILIYIGYFRVEIYEWIKYLFLILIVVEILGYISMTFRYFKNYINKLILSNRKSDKKEKTDKTKQTKKQTKK